MEKDLISLKYLEKFIYNYKTLPQDQTYLCPRCKQWVKEVYYSSTYECPEFSGLLICGTCGGRTSAYDWKSKNYTLEEI